MSEIVCTVLRLTASDGGDGVTVTLSETDGETKETSRLTVSAADYAALDLRRGEVTEETVFALRDADARYHAVRAAIRLLAAGQCNRKKLYDKLRARKFSAKDAEYACAFAAENGYIDEAWQIRSYLRELFGRRHYGARKIIAALAAKGYSAQEVRAVLEETCTAEDFAAAKEAFLGEKFGKTQPETADEARAMRAALYKQGF